MTMTKTFEALEAVQKAALGASRECRDATGIQVGQHVRQGDVYLVRVEPRLVPDDEPLLSRQLAPGSSQGSRHVATGPVMVIDAGSRPSETPAPCLIGPRVVADGTWVLEHPEHAHCRLPAGHYQVVYQSDPTTGERVAD